MCVEVDVFNFFQRFLVPHLREKDVTKGNVIRIVQDIFKSSLMKLPIGSDWTFCEKHEVCKEFCDPKNGVYHCAPVVFNVLKAWFSTVDFGVPSPIASNEKYVHGCFKEIMEFLVELGTFGGLLFNTGEGNKRLDHIIFLCGIAFVIAEYKRTPATSSPLPDAISDLDTKILLKNEPNSPFCFGLCSDGVDLELWLYLSPNLPPVSPPGSPLTKVLIYKNEFDSPRDIFASCFQMTLKLACVAKFWESLNFKGNMTIRTMNSLHKVCSKNVSLLDLETKPHVVKTINATTIAEKSRIVFEDFGKDKASTPARVFNHLRTLYQELLKATPTPLYALPLVFASSDFADLFSSPTVNGRECLPSFNIRSVSEADLSLVIETYDVGISRVPQNCEEWEEWARCIYSALCYLHRLGVCHTDLRLNNAVYIPALVGQRSRWMLIDFENSVPFSASRERRDWLFFAGLLRHSSQFHVLDKYEKFLLKIIK